MYSEKGEQDFNRTTQAIVVRQDKSLNNTIINPLPSSCVSSHVFGDYEMNFSANCSLGKQQLRISAGGFQGNDLSRFDDIERHKSDVTFVLLF